MNSIGEGKYIVRINCSNKNKVSKLHNRDNWIAKNEINFF